MQRTCIIIPCYNEFNRLDVPVFQAFINAHPSIDFLFVNDGSTDKTLELLKDFQSKNATRVKILDLEKNSGKAEAVRRGMLSSNVDKAYDLVGFWDADLSTPLSEINFLTDKLGDGKIAIGSRMKRLGATVERKRWRHLIGRVFSTFASIILKLPVYDTQCGAKLFRTDTLYIFENQFQTRWLFDIELLARYRNKVGVAELLNTVVEVPVNSWLEKGGSKLKFTYMMKVPLELMRINNKYNKKK